MPAFFVQNVPWLCGFQVGHTHTSEVVDNGLCHPDGGKEVQVANPHFDWTGSPRLLSFVFAHTTDKAEDRTHVTPFSI